ncbi:MAG: hypothetical protein ACHQDE_03730 [Acidimicrobiia bacterium]
MRAGTVVTSSGAPATRVRLDRSTGLLVPITPAIVSSADASGETREPDDRLDRALAAIFAFTNRTPADIHVHVDVPGQPVSLRSVRRQIAVNWQALYKKVLGNSAGWLIADRRGATCDARG